MSLKLFLLLVIVLMALLWALPTGRNANDVRWWTAKSPFPFFIFIVVALIASYGTFVRYAKSKGTPDYYKNTDYHILQQDGLSYPIGQTALLCSSSDPDRAAFSANYGELWLDENVCLNTRSFNLPLYVHKADYDENEYKVVNNINEYGMNSGDKLLVLQGQDTLLWIQYSEISKQATTWKQKMRKGMKKVKGIREFDFMFCFKVQGNTIDTVIKTSFSKGYNLAELLQEGSNTRLNPDLFDLFNACYLIRDSYKLDDNERLCTSQSVYLFVNDDFNNHCSVCKNGNPINSRVNNSIEGLNINNGSFFYGLGKTASAVYNVSTSENNVFVKLRLPRMYHLPSDLPTGETKMFLTTDIQDIVDHRNDYKCFYQFNEQPSDNNIYKATAVINFNIDKAGVQLSPEYAYWYNNNSNQQSDVIPINADESFDVKTVSCRAQESNIAQLSYLFTIRDMRNNEVYKGSFGLYFTLLIMLFVIYLLIHILPKKDSRLIKKWYIIETSVYLTLIAFLTVRMVVLWRLHTFPPIENASFQEFSKLTNPSIFNFTIYCIVGVLSLRILILLLKWVAGNKYEIEYKSTTSSKWRRLYVILQWISKILERCKALPQRFFDTIQKNRDLYQYEQNKKKKVKLFFKKWEPAVLLPIIAYLVCTIFANIFPKLCVAIKEGVAPLLAFAINSLFFVYMNNRSTAGKVISTKIRFKDLFTSKFWKPVVRSIGFYCWIAIFLNMVIFLGFLCSPIPLIGFNEKGMFLPILAAFLFWLLIAVWFSKDLSLWKWFVSIFSVIALGIVFLHGALAQTETGKNCVSKIPLDQIKARMQTLIYTPTEMVQSENVTFKGETMQAILNASSNKWFIDNHLIQRERICHDNPDFVLDKEYNQLAVSYVTQTRDLILLRFVIYEHGKVVVNRLLFILVLLTINILIAYKKKDKWNDMPYMQYLPMQSALFLLVFSSYLFLVNMNAVIFVGLDFPFLTLSSKIAPLGLLLPLLAILIPLNIACPDQNLAVDSNNPDNDIEKRKLLASTMFAGFFMLFLVWSPGHSVKKQVKQHYIDGKWQLSSFSISMEPLAEFINVYLNPTFKEWQDDNLNVKKMAVNNGQLQQELQKFIKGNSPNGNNNHSEENLFHKKLIQFAKDHPDNPSDTLFIKSAFDKFFQTSLTDSRNLIHIRKVKGYFTFVTNKVYFDMKPIFRNDVDPDWEGDLLASNNSSRLYFVGGTDTERPREWSISSTDNSQSGRDGNNRYKNFLYNNESKKLCNLCKIPARYCYKADQDVFILMVLDGGSGYTLYPKGDVTNSFIENYGMKLLPNDEVKVIGAKHAFAIRTENEYYFAKHIHYNGKHQAIYPLKDRFIFAYNFERMLADNYHPTDSATHNVRISLDYELFESVYGYCERAMRNNHRYGDGVAVTAVDGNGRIRLLLDYNPHNNALIDPNQNKAIRDRLNEIYLNGDVEAEHALLQNRNLCFMPIGPGSTIKVPFYAALLSRAPLNWNSLGVQFPTNIRLSGKSSYGSSRDVVPNFGHDPVLGMHYPTIKGWDEMSGEYSHNEGTVLYPSDFIKTSNNFYFGTMLMLGGYSDSKMQEGFDEVLEASTPEARIFPKIVLNNNYYTFRPDVMHDIQNCGTSGISHALEQGLMDWFHFKVTDYKIGGSDPLEFYDNRPITNLFKTGYQERAISQYSNYVYSIVPKLTRDIESATDVQSFYKDHFNLTAGGSKVLSVSPLNMSEMYLRLATLNNSDGSILTYNDDVQRAPQHRTDGVRLPENFLAQMQNTVFSGMHKVIYEQGGTLYHRVGQTLQNELNEKGIFIYAKTGTATANNVNNYHYAFILSNMDLQNHFDRGHLKVYIIYFSYYNSGLGHTGSRDTRDRIIHEIINSESFKNYWEQ